MSEHATAAGTKDEPCCKLVRVARRRGIADLEEDLVQKWARTEDRYSLRELAEHFNQELVRAVLEQHDVAPLQGEASFLYDLFTDPDVSGGMKIQFENRLEEYGIDPDVLESDFVSYQTVNRHFNQCLDLSREPADSKDFEENVESVRAMQSRTEAITSRTLEQFRGSEELALGEFEVTVNVSVTCLDCWGNYSLNDLVDRGACDCTTE